MAYQYNSLYSQNFTRIKLTNYVQRKIRGFSTSYLGIQYCPFQETTGFTSNSAAPIIDPSFTYLDGFSYSNTPQASATFGVPNTINDVGGLRLTCQEGSLYRIKGHVTFNSSLLYNFCIMRYDSAGGFDINTAYNKQIAINSARSAYMNYYNSRLCNFDSYVRLNQGDILIPALNLPTGFSDGTTSLTINEMVINIIKVKA